MVRITSDCAVQEHSRRFDELEQSAQSTQGDYARLQALHSESGDRSAELEGELSRSRAAVGNTPHHTRTRTLLATGRLDCVLGCP